MMTASMAAYVALPLETDVARSVTFCVCPLRQNQRLLQSTNSSGVGSSSAGSGGVAVSVVLVIVG